MARSRVVRFLASYVAVGVAVALGVVWLAPELLTPDRPVVEIRQAPRDGKPAVAEVGPVSYAGAVRRAAPAVVNVYTSKEVEQPRSPFFDDPFFRRFFGERRAPSVPRTETSLGSGVILSSDGYVLTNNHVVKDANEIQVLLADGRSGKATVVGTDPDTDLAVLRIGLRPLPVVTTGNSESLDVGDVVLAIGNPFGVGQTVTQGIVSATGRNQLGLATFEDFIQTDAAINPGNSGGALISARGELIGINTAIYSRSGGSMGIGFAIPVKLAQGVMADIIEHGRVIRGWIGVQVQTVTPQLAESFGLKDTRGVVIAGIYRGGPAAEAGLRPGDVVRSLGDNPVGSAQDLLRRVARSRPDSMIELGGVRDGEKFTVSVKVAPRPVEVGTDSAR